MRCRTLLCLYDTCRRRPIKGRSHFAIANSPFAPSLWHIGMHLPNVIFNTIFKCNTAYFFLKLTLLAAPSTLARQNHAPRHSWRRDKVATVAVSDSLTWTDRIDGRGPPFPFLSPFPPAPHFLLLACSSTTCPTIAACSFVVAPSFPPPPAATLRGHTNLFLDASSRPSPAALSSSVVVRGDPPRSAPS